MYCVLSPGVACNTQQKQKVQNVSSAMVQRSTDPLTRIENLVQPGPRSRLPVQMYLVSFSTGNCAD